MELSDLSLHYTRLYMVDVHGKQYPIKQQRGRFYIQHAKGQFTVTSAMQKNDWCFDYVFGGLSVSYPCPAIDYFIHRHRMGRRISASDYKKKFLV